MLFLKRKEYHKNTDLQGQERGNPFWRQDEEVCALFFINLLLERLYGTEVATDWYHCKRIYNLDNKKEIKAVL